jgi:pantoate--beta-alanine ligase
MRRVLAIADVRRAVAAWKRAGQRVAFVPTMGAIHAGHLSLVELAKSDAHRVVASVYVNPLQFGPQEDFRRYPRPVMRDRGLLAAAGVDLLWEPQPDELQPRDLATRVRVRGLDETLEGFVRPGHFEGVATVVMQLLNVVQPHVLWLGQKDAQQARIVERMVRDLHVPVAVRRGPTIRERDGLALSSRNTYLSREDRAQAVGLARALAGALAALRDGERSAARLRAVVRREWKRFPRLREDYVAVVDAETLKPVRRVEARVLIAVAGRIGGTRLIDNFEWTP